MSAKPAALDLNTSTPKYHSWHGMPTFPSSADTFLPNECTEVEIIGKGITPLPEFAETTPSCSIVWVAIQTKLL